MPVPAADPPSIIPPLTRSRLLRFRFSEWYPVFKRASIRGTVFKFPVDDQALFTTWFEEDGMRLPEGVLPSGEDDNDDDDESVSIIPSSRRPALTVSLLQFILDVLRASSPLSPVSHILYQPHFQHLLPLRRISQTKLDMSARRSVDPPLSAPYEMSRGGGRVHGAEGERSDEWRDGWT